MIPPATLRGQKRRRCLKRLRETDPAHESVIKAQNLDNRRNRKYERKKAWSVDPVRALKRFHKLAIQIRDKCIGMYGHDVFKTGDLDCLKSEYRGLLNQEAMHSDLVIEFVELMMTFQFIFPDHDGERTSQMVKIMLNQKINNVEVMHYSNLKAYSADVILLHNGKLYHNSHLNVTVPEDFQFEIVRIKKSDPSRYHTMKLESFLLDQKGISMRIDDL